jgi:hypothetical protein
MPMKIDNPVTGVCTQPARYPQPAPLLVMNDLTPESGNCAPIAIRTNTISGDQVTHAWI